ncbi:hypothetical protein EKD04_017935 [Chloroflexales bacterium ZM16-3]|nr:hypothetical protein [Chloroflexales bacterium ZM16-3]
MLYRVRGSLHPDTTHIATELRGLIAHTGPIRLGYLQMHGVAAQTIQVRDDAAAFFEETLLPKIGAAGSFVEQRAALRQPKELRLAATLCPTTATALPDLRRWAGVWGEVVYAPGRTTVRVRCLPEDAERLRELEGQGWRVRRGPLARLPWLARAAPFAPQFWPAPAAPAPAPARATPALAAAAAAPSPSTLTAAEVLAAADAANLLLGVTPTGEGVRLAWRAMIVAVQDGGERQESVVGASLLRALAQGMGALVIAERAKVTPRLLAPLADRLRIIDMADPWESARIPWRSLPPEALTLLLGGAPPSPLPETLADALRAAGRPGAATPVLEALTREPAYDLAGTLEAGGGVVLLLEPGASASLLASLLILGLSLAPLTRPLLICRPAALPVPPSLASQAVQFVFGDAPTAALQLQATPGAWTAIVPDGTQIVLQEDLTALVVERAGADHAALVGGLQGLGWAAGTSPRAGAAEGADIDLSWPDGLEAVAEADLTLPEASAQPEGTQAPLAATDEGLTLQGASALPDDAGIAGLGWPEGIEETDEAGLTLQEASALPNDAGIAGLGWPEAPEEAEADAGLTLQGASEQPEGPEAPLVAADAGLTLQGASAQPEGAEAPLAAADEGLTLQGASDLPDETNDVAPFDIDEWPALLFDDALLSDTFDHAPHARRPKPHRRNRLVLHASRAHRSSAEAGLTLQGASDQPEGAEAPLVAADEGLTLQGASDLPEGAEAEAGLTLQGASDQPEGAEAPLVAADEGLTLQGASDQPEGAEAEAGLGWPEAPEGAEAEAGLTLQGASDQPEGAEAPLVAAADEGLTPQGASDQPEGASVAGLGWPEAPEGEVAEAGLTLQGASDQPEGAEAPLVAADEGLTLQGASDQLDEDVTDLVAAWHRGEGMRDLARELRRRRPALSLLDAMRTLKAAINAPSPPPASPPPPAAHGGLEAVLRGLAAETPTLPEERDTLQSWRSGGQRRDVVREVAATYGMREAEARAIYDRLVLPRVISDMNGSAAEVLRILREPHGGDRATIPPPVMDCISRLLGTPKTNAGIARSLLPSLRETLADLDTTGRP